MSNNGGFAHATSNNKGRENLTGKAGFRNPAASRPDGLRIPEVVAGGHLGAPYHPFWGVSSGVDIKNSHC